MKTDNSASVSEKAPEAREKNKPGNRILITLLILFLVAVFYFCAFMLIRRFVDGSENKEKQEALVSSVVTKPDDKNNGGVLDSILQTREKEYAPISVDFDELKKTSGNITAWLYSESESINYPVVQASEDNNYYLTHNVDGTENSFGSIFTDFRCSSDFSDLNTLLHGHRMVDGTMFGTLTNYKKQEYYDSYPVMYLLTPEKDYKLQLIYGYVADSGSEIFVIPSDSTLIEKALEYAKENSTFRANFEYEYSEGDSFVALSTCDYSFDTAKYVLLGVLCELDRK